MTSDAETDIASRRIELTRTLDAPRERVFEAWTDPAQIGLWWGPRGFTTTTKEMDVRPGGVWRFVMHGPDGTDYGDVVRYEEVVEPERLVYVHASDDDHEPQRFHVRVTFDDLEGRTRLTMRLLFDTAEQRDKVVQSGAIEGGNQTIDRLVEHLARTEPAGSAKPRA